mmetsp:Transcript_13351/g.25196  ORF Transcript_13351/g.25196 Transcript_13351/m.25196 type:complete len:424 (-) Transcript_13351:110-1381(-)
MAGATRALLVSLGGGRQTLRNKGTKVSEVFRDARPSPCFEIPGQGPSFTTDSAGNVWLFAGLISGALASGGITQKYCLAETRQGKAKVGARSLMDDASIDSVKWGRYDDYHMSQLLGKGTYGEVFEGTSVVTGSTCAIKRFKATSIPRLQREMKVLEHLHGGPNIIELRDVLLDKQTEQPCLVFEHVKNTNYRKLYMTFSDKDIRHYMFELLKALDYCSSQGIMHRDVKPGNIVLDNAEKKLRLIDFGMADFYEPGQPYSVKVSSRYYKAPELLVGYRCYDYSVDVWSAGCILASLVFRRTPFFHGEDDRDQLARIIRVLGTRDLHRYLEKYDLSLDPSLAYHLQSIPRKSWSHFIHDGNAHLANRDALDLLDKMLVYDHAARISPKEAMNHPYFKEVREQEDYPDEASRIIFQGRARQAGWH